MEKLSVSIHIIGHVQGVFFRQSVAAQAKQLQVSGFVRNEPDGSVYCEVEGEIRSLNTFLDWCKRGPPHARVERVTSRRQPLRHFTTFTIERTPHG